MKSVDKMIIEYNERRYPNLAALLHTYGEQVREQAALTAYEALVPLGYYQREVCRKIREKELP